ncbi:MAG: ROK family protein [Candidatus Nomurabacteria bacterium]|nr:ROK family protein [Candidatus Nomurabacteria bacterium]
MYLCVDIGGTKTLVALVNEAGKIVRFSKFATAFDQKRFFAMLVEEIRIGFCMDNVRAISVAMPGPTEKNQALWLGNLPWANFDIAGDLNAEFGLPVFVENDANLAGLAEAASFRGLSVYLTFSTGVGGGVVRNGEMEASTRIYEPGHDKYEWDGNVMEWEDFASAKAVADYFGKLTSEISSPDDWHEVAMRIATGLHSVVSSIRPNHIIFGGPLGLELKKYQRYLKKELEEQLSPGAKMPKLTVAKLGDKSVIYGCYIYARDQLVN